MRTSHSAATLAVVLVVLLVTGSLGSPAVAQKKKKGTHIHDTFAATAVPLPLTASDTTGLTPGCSAGVEGIHKVTHQFTAPGKGILKVYIEGFTGDWDLYIFVEGMAMARADASQAPPDLAPPEEEINYPMTKGQAVDIVACNWAGQPTIDVHYEGLFL